MTRPLTRAQVLMIAEYARHESIKQAAEAMGVHHQTAKNRLSDAYGRLGVETLVGALKALGWLRVPAGEEVYIMSGWTVNAEATSGLGVVTETKDHSERNACVNLTDMGDGTAVISLTLVVPSSNARAWAEHLLREHARDALPEKP